MNIPYTLDRRADTGVSNTTLGLWLFLASEVMLFGALFSAYALLRVSAPAWPSGRTLLNPMLGGINTVVLLAATGIIWRARAQPVARARQAVLIGTALSLVFLVIKAIEYRQEIAAGSLPSVNTFLACYFTLTGLHALHVLGGVVANVWAVAGRAGAAMAANRIRLISLYWTFVDAVWLVVFVLLYLS